jgi:hypothetical protein
MIHTAGRYLLKFDRDRRATPTTRAAGRFMRFARVLEAIRKRILA